MRMIDEYVELLEFIAELEKEDFDFGEYFAQHPDGAKHECLAIRLQNAGYLNGLCLFGEMDGQMLPRIMWARSRPRGHQLPLRHGARGGIAGGEKARRTIEKSARKWYNKGAEHRRKRG